MKLAKIILVLQSTTELLTSIGVLLKELAAVIGVLMLIKIKFKKRKAALPGRSSKSRKTRKR